MGSLSEHLWTSDQSRSCNNQLVTFSTYAGILSSAGIFEEHGPTLYDLISLLTAAQMRNIDFLPITWQPTLDTAGKGATAVIQQSLISLAMTFAFKRYLTSDDVDETRKYYRVMISEIFILGHPAIKQHPNIVKLQGICWDVISEDQIWPVLVFQKAKFGNLHEFFASDEATRVKSDQCISLIAGIVHAVMFMHSHGQLFLLRMSLLWELIDAKGIIHGDLKPDNILVVPDEVHGFRAELCDFGFSTINASDKLIQLPYSWPWTAPEYHHRGFYLRDAKRIDIYSLGLVSLWVLNTYRLRRQSQTMPVSDNKGVDDTTSDANQARYQWIENLKSSDTIPQFIDDCLGDLVDFGEHNVLELRHFLLDTLDNRPETRTLRNIYLPPPSLPEISDRLLCPSPETEDFQKQFDLSYFQLAHSLTQLIESHIVVRKVIARRLEVRASCSSLTTLREKARIQLAICLGIGFGVERSVEKSSSLADSCFSSHKILMADLIALHSRTHKAFQYSKIQEMFERGLLQNMDYVYENQKLLSPGSIEMECRRELMDMKQVFRNTNALVYSVSMQLVYILWNVGKLHDAQALLNQLIMDSENDPDYPQRSIRYLAALEAQAITARRLCDYSLGKRLAAFVLEELKSIWGPLHLRTSSARTALASIHMEAGEYDQAVALLQEDLEILRNELGPDHQDTLSTFGTLAQSLQLQGQLGAAEDAATQVYEGFTRMLGVSHPNTLASAGNLASIQRSRGKLGAAQTLLEKSLELYEMHYGASNSSTFTTLNRLALLYVDLGYLDAAEKNFKRVIQGREILYGRRHPETQAAVNNLACVLLRRHKFKSAERLYKEVLEISRETLGEEHHETVAVANNLALVYHKQHDYVQAEALYIWSYNRTRKHVGDEHPVALKILSNISGLLLDQRKLNEAESTYRQLLQHQGRSLGLNHPSVLLTMTNLAGVLQEQGKLEESESIYRNSLNAKLQQFDRYHPSVLRTVSNMSSLLLRRGDYRGSEEMALWAVEGHRSALGSHHPDTISSVMILKQSRRALSSGVDISSLSMI